MTDFQDVSWSDDEDITDDKLNQMSSNMKYLNERIIPIKYSAYGLNKTDGLKIASGIINFPATTGRQMVKDVSFGTYFDRYCRPSIQATCAVTDQHRTFCTIQGQGVGNLRPGADGFRIVLNADPLTEQKIYFPSIVHVHWLAIGY